VPAVTRPRTDFAPPALLPNAETRQRSPEIGLEVKANAALMGDVPRVLAYPPESGFSPWRQPRSSVLLPSSGTATWSERTSRPGSLLSQ
jgi:hypothetical protein